jgi:hypothetical protein
MAMTTATQRTVAILGSGGIVGRAPLPRARSHDAALAVFSVALESGGRRPSLR